MSAASPYHGTQSSSYGSRDGPRAKCDQVMLEALAKTVEVILQSRSSTDSSPSSPPNSRFNLRLPVLPQVREMVDRWKGGALHVPMRIDVSFQSPSPEQDPILLERWCLQYHTRKSPQREEGYHEVSEDLHPHNNLHQLRHVCKRIVVWLRTLYSASRLLPATGLCAKLDANRRSFHEGVPPVPSIGFSIYAVSSEESTAQPDDVKSLLAQHGFRYFAHPSIVSTPYGELTLSCTYIPFESLPKVALESRRNPRAIPVSQPTSRQLSQTSSPLHAIHPQSVPAHHHYLQPHDRLGPSYGGVDSGFGMTGTYATTSQYPQHAFPRSFKSSTMTSPHSLTRRHSQEASASKEHHTRPLYRHDSDTGVTSATLNSREMSSSSQQQPPKRIMSGLSLAMMNSASNNMTSQEAEITTSKPTLSGTELGEISQEHHRAALHEPPPVLPPHPQHQEQPDYGYAYNNHIPWQRIHPSNSHATNLDAQGGNTPMDDPTKAISGATTAPSLNPSTSTPPTPGLVFGPGSYKSSKDAIHGLSVTPPFPHRTVGFDGPAPVVPPLASQNQHQAVIHREPSLEHLRSSPFQQSAVFGSSLGLGGPSAAAATMIDAATSSALGSLGLMAGNFSSSTLQPNFLDEMEEMPFALDSNDDIFTSRSQSKLAGSEYLQKSVTSSRLKMFDSSVPDNTTTADLAQQLADLKSFGQSIH